MTTTCPCITKSCQHRPRGCSGRPDTAIETHSWILGRWQRWMFCRDCAVEAEARWPDEARIVDAARSAAPGSLPATTETRTFRRVVGIRPNGTERILWMEELTAGSRYSREEIDELVEELREDFAGMTVVDPGRPGCRSHRVGLARRRGA